MLSQYEYAIEYRKAATYGKADVLSRLPVQPDDKFEKEQEEDDTHVVNTINTVSLQLKATDPELLAKSIRQRSGYFYANETCSRRLNRQEGYLRKRTLLN